MVSKFLFRNQNFFFIVCTTDAGKVILWIEKRIAVVNKIAMLSMRLNYR